MSKKKKDDDIKLEYDNTPTLVQKEERELTLLLNLIEKSLSIIEVINEPKDGTTRFVLSPSSLDHVKVIEDALSRRNADIYTISYTMREFNQVDFLSKDKRDSPQTPSYIPITKETIVINRRPLISFNRPLSFTLLLKVVVIMIIIYFTWLIYRIIL